MNDDVMLIIVYTENCINCNLDSNEIQILICQKQKQMK